MASDQLAGKLARLYLIGPLRLIDAGGLDRTPRGRIVQALLAILALSPDGTRVRAKLQDMLWGGSDQTRGSQSLRNALTRLRHDLAFLQPRVIRADRQVVHLNTAEFWIDVFAYSAGGRALLRQRHGAEIPDLLEGIDIRTSSEDEFEDWLSLERQYWRDRLEDIADAAEDDEPEAPTEAPAARLAEARSDVGTGRRIAPTAPFASVGVGLLPSIAFVTSRPVGLLADVFLDSVAQGLRDFMQAEIYDYRDQVEAFPLPVDQTGPLVMLRVKLTEAGGQLRLTLNTHGPSPRELLWAWSVDVPAESSTEAITVFANQAVDRVCQTLLSLAPAPGTGYAAYHALNLMFRLGTQSFEAARAILERGHADSGDPVHLSLLAYLNSFKVGEHWGHYDRSVGEETRHLVDATLAKNPFNSLILAMTGHACGYVLHDHNFALDLLERSISLDPSPAIAWDHLAVNYLYVGRLDEALQASQKATRLGSFSPFRFTYDATMLMICTIRGDYESAIRYGERSLARRPNYCAALRYMTVSLSHLGRLDEAANLVSRIRSMAPDFSSDWVASDRLAVADPQAKYRLLIGLKRAGA